MLKIALAFVALISSVSSFALEVEYFRFTNSKTYALTDDALLENSLVKNNYPWLLTTAVDYVKVPLSIQNDKQRTDEIVKSLMGLHLGGGVRVTRSLFLGARTYFAKIDSDAGNGTYWGDSALEAKWRFYQTDNSALALAPALYLPTGTQTFTTNRGKVGEYLGLNYERNFNWFQLSLMAGYSNLPGSTFNLGSSFTSIDYKRSIYTAVGSIFPLSDTWALNIEGYRHNQLKGNQHPNEGYVGLRNQTTPSLNTFFGASLGGLIDETANDFRVSFGIKYAPIPEETKVVESRPLVKEKPVVKQTLRDAGLMKEQEQFGELISSETIYFKNASSVVDSFSQDVIKKFFRTMNKVNSSKYTIVLEGFASKTGNSQRNMKLSTDRIHRTRQYLASIGTNSKAVSEVAYGDANADVNISEALNRKVMLRLYKK
jgi:outer membrane protein OmpA-like peptidoglycan-associated protein